MGFQRITLFQFRNLQDAEVDVNSPEVFLVGENGQGKSNFMESIYLLCYGSSFRTRLDGDLVRHGCKSMSIRGDYIGSAVEEVFLKIEGTTKIIQTDKKRVQDRKQLIDQMPCIVFCHDDIDFVSGTPERRRWFFNQTMSLNNPLFIDTLRQYAKVIKMRNAAIKNNEMGDLLSIYDQQAAALGLEIQRNRGNAIDRFNETFSKLFHRVSGLPGDINIRYSPSWKNAETIDQALRIMHERRKTDLLLKTSTSGPHRDRMSFYLDEREFSKIASTGQRRLMSLVLRVAQALFFTQESGKKPVLLIDDVLLELDAQKRERFLMELPDYEQAFFTFLPDEPYDRYKRQDTKVFDVSAGALSSV
ncbi:MAG: DNA replication and repair protein RecF [Spirochaetales bacterium]|nr:DNA replication and repair protein RecF [Spirochaetales bacterium]